MSHPVPIFGTQDLKDDDAAVIDSYLIETDAPPDMTPAKQAIPDTPDEGITVTTRLIAREFTLQPGWDPQLLLPADDNRKHMYLRVYSPTAQAGDAIRFADSSQAARNGARVIQGDAPTIDDHTGAVWVFPESITGTVNAATVNVEFWAVTV